jgi:hypothetical protein
MVDFGKTIDKLIKISTIADLTDDVKNQLDDIIDELINTELIENKDIDLLDSLNRLQETNRFVETNMDSNSESIVPDYSSLSPDELEEIKQFEILVRGVMDGEVAQA